METIEACLIRLGFKLNYRKKYAKTLVPTNPKNQAVGSEMEVMVNTEQYSMRVEVAFECVVGCCGMVASTKGSGDWEPFSEERLKEMEVEALKMYEDE